MIFYTSGGIHYFTKIFSSRGSVFPSALRVAVPSGLLAVAIVILTEHTEYLPYFKNDDSILKETQGWSGFSFLVGFIIVFRTSQAYSRFWEGCASTHTMRAEWFDACSALISFCQHSKTEKAKIMRFKHTLVRLFSMLHASALADLEEVNSHSLEQTQAFTYELIDPAGIDDASMATIKKSESRVELIFEWIQVLIVENIETGVLSIPPPILSRAFQEIANGMVAFHDSVKLSYIPFPFPYAQTCDCLLCLHCVIVPFVIAQWVTHPVFAFVFVFIQVFILWSLNFIAVEIENPFGTDLNDLDGQNMQEEMNRHLELLLQPSTIRAPHLSRVATWSEDPDEVCEFPHSTKISFQDVWYAQAANRAEHQSRPTFERKVSQPALAGRLNYLAAMPGMGPNQDAYYGSERHTPGAASKLLRASQTSMQSLTSTLTPHSTNKYGRSSEADTASTEFRRSYSDTLPPMFSPPVDKSTPRKFLSAGDKPVKAGRTSRRIAAKRAMGSNASSEGVVEDVAVVEGGGWDGTNSASRVSNCSGESDGSGCFGSQSQPSALGSGAQDREARSPGLTIRQAGISRSDQEHREGDKDRGNRDGSKESTLTQDKRLSSPTESL